MAIPPRSVKTNKGQIWVYPARRTIPRTALFSRNQEFVMNIKVRREARSIATPATGANPRVAKERTRLRVPSMVPEAVMS
jgi:hypothetical protein